MEEITFKRLLRWTLASLIAVIAIAYGFGVGIASAETGSITITSSSNLVYTPIDNAPASAVNWGRLVFDIADYNKISNFRWFDGASLMTFAYDYESTSFTCNAPNICSGVFWYDKSTKSVYYVFIGNPVISASAITLTFSNVNVPNNVTGNWGHGLVLSSTQPIYILNGVAADGGANAGTYQNVVAISEATDLYNVTYPFSNGFTINVTKGNVVNTKWKILDGANNQYTTESSFNKINFQYTNSNYNGIIFNVSKADGSYTLQTINLTGTSYFIASVPTPTINPITGGGIYWDATQYNIGQTGNIIYAFNDNAWYDFLYSKKVEVYDQSSSILSQFDAGQSGTFPFTFLYSGTYKAKLQKYFLGVFSSTYEEDSTIVLSLNNIFTTKSTYTNIENVNIYGNYSGKGKGYLYVGKNLNSPDYKLAVVAGQYNYTLVNLSSGKWDISLLEYDDYTPPDCVGSTGLSSCFHTKAAKSFYVTTANQTLSISWDKSEVFTGSSANYNFQNNSGADIIRIYRPDNTTYYITTAQDQFVNYRNSGTVYFYYDVRNIGVWEARITNASNLSHSVSAFITVKINTGANVTNSYGASMYWGLLQNTPKTNNKLYWGLGTIPTLTPNSVSINIMKVQTNANMKTFVVTADGDQDIYFIAAGIYQAQMLYNNSVIAVSNIEITSGTSITPTPTPITTTPSVSETSNDIVSLFSQKIFWALIFIVGLALMVAKRERKG